MTEFVAKGLDGSNPLHVLAALGLLRMSDRLTPGARLGWRLSGARWTPVYSQIPEDAEWIEAVAAGLRVVASLGTADAGVNRRAKDAATELKRLVTRRKAIEKELRQEIRKAGLKKDEAEAYRATALAQIDDLIATAGAELTRAQKDQQAANGIGIAHIGDAIGVDAASFRSMGSEALELWHSSSGTTLDRPADPQLLVYQWPALGCDGVAEDGKVSPTPYSFSNGSGGQYLLKDFRGCASRVSASRLRSTLTGDGLATDSDATSLNWDPTDQVSHALVWQDPQAREKSTDIAANALAYLGLSLLPCAPIGRGLAAVGWHGRAGFTWPIWSSPLGLESVASLLALIPKPERIEMDALAARGVIEVRFSARVNPDGKRNFFGPSRPVS